MTDWREALQRTMYPILTRLLQEGFVLPLFVTCIGRNGSMMCGRYDNIAATGLDFIFETSHIKGAAFLVPIHMLVVDQRGEAAHVRCDDEDTQDTPCPACGDSGRPLRENTELAKHEKGLW
jgi:hypothetical protein